MGGVSPWFFFRAAFEVLACYVAGYLYFTARKGAAPRDPLQGVRSLAELQGRLHGSPAHYELAHSVDAALAAQQGGGEQDLRRQLDQAKAKMHDLEQKVVQAQQQVSQSREALNHQRSSWGSRAADGPANDEPAFHALALAGESCHGEQNAEYWGDPLVWGGTHHTANAAECCAACQAHRRTAQRGQLAEGAASKVCNTWVFCGGPSCGIQKGECWLKVQQGVRLNPAGRKGVGVPWTSGVVIPPEEAELEHLNGRPGKLVARTPHGDIVFVLRPDLAPDSVRELKRMAALLGSAGGKCSGCHLYRSEKNFLLQGVIRHPGFYVETPRKLAPPQQKVMERGLACWAGGMGGPDFFVNLIDQRGFGDSHLCWGKIEDMTVVDHIMTLPLKPKKLPNEMTFLLELIYFDLAVVQ
eukprot:CAMPEP_0182854880 /NCGR_PEP_ID=MMETSP0034_2-20130328/1519_1 /TAXON_ID=156128 /ORGANISM="Nephroselmis pyriformis, Strain CCMP717" /LENGTH=411 /DNA_ID=CAMNT_0024985769 /DNA_START=200 /DNA_END=1435 /DNA_ORIENTATION=+